MNKTTKYHKQNANTEYSGTWQGLAGGTEVQLADPKNAAGAKGTFGQNDQFANYGLPIANSGISTARELIEGTDYQYNKRIDASVIEDPIDGFGNVSNGITDTNHSGALSATGHIRIVNDGKNIRDVSGLFMKIYAKNMATGLLSPPQDRFYVDPAKGIFVGPQPLFWCKMDSNNDLMVPSIAPTYPTFISSGTHDFTGGKFGLCLRQLWTNIPNINAYENRYHNYVQTNIASSSIQKGSASFWIYITNSGSTSDYDHGGVVSFGGQLTCPSRAYAGNEAPMSVNGWGVGIKHFTDEGAVVHRRLFIFIGSSYAAYVDGLAQSTWHHVFVNWDYSGGLPGGKTIRATLNGTTSISTNLAPTVVPNFQAAVIGERMWWSGIGDWGLHAHIDNLKIWDYVIEDGSFEYNSGTGRESAMHPIYGSANDYAPKNLKVGYHAIASSLTPATCPKPGSNSQITLESINSFDYTSGYICAPVPLQTISYTDFVESTDYEYYKRMDASDTEDPVDGFGYLSGGTIDIFTSGPLGLSKTLRIVNSGKSIKDPTGLNLKVYAENLKNIHTPPKDRVYVDPANGKIIFPGPKYFSKCETVENLRYADILYTSSSIESGGDFEIDTVAGKFGNGVIFTSAAVPSYYKIKPGFNCSDQMTMSFWLQVDKSLYNMNTFQIMPFSNKINIQLGTINNKIVNKIKINNIDVSIDETVDFGTLKHVYIVWDRTNGLSGNRSVRIFVNGVEILYTLVSFPTMAGDVFNFEFSNNHGFEISSKVLLDNIKIYDHVVSEDPSWEYNSGAGREEAMHEIYGATDNYELNIEYPNGGVGYYQKGGSKNYSRWSVPSIT